MRDAYIYKILRDPEWAELQGSGLFHGSADDIRDGFIHLSTKDQLQSTLDKHYTDGAVVILAEIAAHNIAANLKYENSRGGAEFPHLYGTLAIDDVIRYWRLSPNAKGRYVIGEGLMD